MVVHAVPSTICRRHIAIIVARACAMSLMNQNTIQTIFEFQWHFIIIWITLSTHSITASSDTNIWSYIKHLWEGDVACYFAACYTIPSEKNMEEYNISMIWISK
jgi:hypothetical protein